jgi:hypothetical protein
MSRGFRMAKAGRPSRVPEKTEQAHIVQLLLSINAAVFVLGTRRPRGDYAGTCQTPGLPDLVAFLPSTREHGTRQVWIECKAIGGRLRSEQQNFRTLCECAGVAHIVGTFDDVIAWLAGNGYVKASQFPHYRQPQAPKGIPR